MTKFNYSFEKNTSKVHKSVVSFFKKEFPSWEIWQNYPIKIDNKTLYADIYCKSPFNFILEINGEQHYEYVAHFHKTLANFKKAQYNDTLKKDWAEMNDFIHIEIRAKDFKTSEFKNYLLEKLDNA